MENQRRENSMSVKKLGQPSKMSSFTKTRLGQFLSRLTKSADARKSRRRRFVGGATAEILEERQLLAADPGDALASAWTHSVIDDDAAAFFDDSYVHDLYITFDNEDWFDVLETSHASDPDDPYFAADFTANGVTIENMGVRFTENSSFDGSGLKHDGDTALLSILISHFNRLLTVGSGFSEVCDGSVGSC
jgi:hypothetical protein